jgi:hypothetical protein
MQGGRPPGMHAREPATQSAAAAAAAIPLSVTDCPSHVHGCSYGACPPCPRETEQQGRLHPRTHPNPRLLPACPQLLLHHFAHPTLVICCMCRDSGRSSPPPPHPPPPPAGAEPARPRVAPQGLGVGDPNDTSTQARELRRGRERPGMRGRGEGRPGGTEAGQSPACRTLPPHAVPSATCCLPMHASPCAATKGALSLTSEGAAPGGWGQNPPGD